MIRTKSYGILRFTSILRSMNWLTFIVFALAFYVHSILSRIAGLTVLDKVVLKYRCTHGYEFYARADDYWRFMGHFEPKTTAFMLRGVNESSIVVDVGAHIGIHTVHLAKRAKLIIAIEPEPRNYMLLKRNLKLNNLRNVLALPIALSDKDGYAYLLIASSSGAHSLGSSNSEVSNVNFVGRVKVRTMTFDSLINYLELDHVDLVKIDVEGHEEAVLKGMKNTLQRNPPRIIIIETDERSHIINTLKSCGYSEPIKLDSWGKRVNYALYIKR